MTRDLGKTQMVARFSLTPWRHPDTQSAPRRDYRTETSADGKTWTVAAEGKFQNIAYALATQRIPFTAPRAMRYLRLTFAATAVPAAKLAIADVGRLRAEREPPRRWSGTRIGSRGDAMRSCTRRR